MGKNIVQKIIGQHLTSGDLAPGTEIALAIDQTLTQDATGTMAYLQFEAMGIPQVKTQLSLSYVDHNTLQASHENADDHRFLQTIAARHGIYFSRPGNGICHQVHTERFAIPGQTLLGADSHTPTVGGVGTLGIGAGGLDVAMAMAGQPFYLTMPKVVLVRLSGKLGPWVAAKDVILEVLRQLTVKGGVGRVIEYGGPGVLSLEVPQRATITNMGAELGATSSIFPSDELTKAFLKAQGREQDWQPLRADADAEYDESVDIDLSSLEPLIALPHSPDNVRPVTEVEGVKVNQICVGSCTNSSFRDLMTIAGILKGKKVHPDVNLTVTPGTKQVLRMIAENGALADLVAAGARILECVCGPCIGMGQAPEWEGVSLRTFNRNFEGRSGTPSAKIYLASLEVAGAAALSGVITDPRRLGAPVTVSQPATLPIDDSSILPPSAEPEKVEIVRGPNIKPLPIAQPLTQTVEAEVLLKVGDNITTDHIMPAGAKILPLRSNVPAISQYVFESVDKSFPERAKKAGSGIVVGGNNYGQGSSREHAALAPMYLGVKAVIVKSFARIHKANLVNFGILPLTFKEASDHDGIEQGDRISISDPAAQLMSSDLVTVRNETKGKEFKVSHGLSPREIEIIKVGGLLNYVKSSQA